MQSATETYGSLSAKYSKLAAELRQELRWLSLVRLLVFAGFIFCLYLNISGSDSWLYFITFLLFAGFFLLIRLYDRKLQQVDFYRALTKLNNEEAEFVEGKSVPFADGKEYIDSHHPYSYDLDIFGTGGLFPYLNRCSTAFGKEALAASLLRTADNILQRQVAIKELTEKLDFRQHLQAHGALLDTKAREMRQLNAWLKADTAIGNRKLYYGLMLFPLVSTTCLVTYFITANEAFLSAFYKFFVLNLVLAVSFTKKISAHLSVSTSVTKILQQFAGQLRQIEGQSFQSALLKDLQAGLSDGSLQASASIARLASLFNYLETVVNLAVSILLNGLFLFHVHILFALEKWKAVNGSRVIPWLNILGQVEAMNSLGNFSYNNPAFTFPSVSSREMLSAENMGHPLIPAARRINNSISFDEQKFVILTGSNMSGKSTFLRTLGINIILAGAGSVVCADRFTFYPFSVHVSMRISDSLQDSESFFYAELKRLHAIIDGLDKGHKTFVILDEILRGTNSNDKHNGTVGLIRKLVDANAVGIIATHDLTVSELTIQNPLYLSNKCFESEIVNDELLFDYRLKDGVCTRLSASFLMKKMGVID